jgi:hypothetical protein
MDSDTEELLTSMQLSNLRVVPLRNVENEQLLSVKRGRTEGEYCWTLAPFSVSAVFNLDSAVRRVTYLDSDVYFFNDPRILLRELVHAGKDVLITEHAYDPVYDQSASCGRFCVQFVTFNNSLEGLRVLKWWQDRCLEWCFNRIEDGKFGDQKYLDSWPELFTNEVHILQSRDETLAPWNVKSLLRPNQLPVMYHFHGLRFISRTRVRLYDGYHVGKLAARLYDEYIEVMKEIARRNSNYQFKLAKESRPLGVRECWRRIRSRINSSRSEVSISGL